MSVFVQVTYDDAQGRPKIREEDRRTVRQHVMLHALGQISNGASDPSTPRVQTIPAGGSSAQSHKRLGGSKSLQHRDKKIQAAAVIPQPRVAPSLGACPVFLPNNVDLVDLGFWFLYPITCDRDGLPRDPPGELADPVLQGLWHDALAGFDLGLLFVTIHSYLRKAEFLKTPPCRTLYASKAAMLGKIRAYLDTCNGSTDPDMIFAIAGLSCLEVRNGNLTAARSHIQGVRALATRTVNASVSAPPATYTDAQAWSLASRSLTRAAQLLRQFPIPIESFGVPSSCPSPLFITRIPTSFMARALENVNGLPRFPSVGPEDSQTLLASLHALRLTEGPNSTADDFQGLSDALRDVEFQTTQLHAKIRNYYCKRKSNFQLKHAMFELVVLAAELFTWVAARPPSLPAGRQRIAAIIQDTRLRDTHSLPLLWTRADGDLKSLLWTLSAFVGYDLKFKGAGIGLLPQLIDEARSLLDDLSITVFAEFQATMDDWPVLPTRHFATLTEIWTAIVRAWQTFVIEH